MPIEIPKDKWPGSIKPVTIGATAAEGGTRTSTVTVGGQTTLPYLQFEAPTPNKPVIAIEIKSRKPDDWSPLLADVWGDAMNDPAEWAKKAEEAGASLIVLELTLEDSIDDAVKAVKSVLKATGLPLIVWGPGQIEKDNHLVQARTAMDVNLAKQLNILITDMGLPVERIVMDPTTGALGYGIEYGYSVMERLRLAALQGDAMTQLPMLVTPGYETWKAKEGKVGEGVPEAWGDWAERGIHWETLTAVALVESGADIVVLRHPESVKRVKETIDELMVTA